MSQKSEATDLLDVFIAGIDCAATPDCFLAVPVPKTTKRVTYAITVPIIINNRVTHSHLCFIRHSDY